MYVCMCECVNLWFTMLKFILWCIYVCMYDGRFDSSGGDSLSDAGGRLLPLRRRSGQHDQRSQCHATPYIHLSMSITTPNYIVMIDWLIDCIRCVRFDIAASFERARRSSSSTWWAIPWADKPITLRHTTHIQTFIHSLHSITKGHMNITILKPQIYIRATYIYLSMHTYIHTYSTCKSKALYLHGCTSGWLHQAVHQPPSGAASRQAKHPRRLRENRRQVSE